MCHQHGNVYAYCTQGSPRQMKSAGSVRGSVSGGTAAAAGRQVGSPAQLTVECLVACPLLVTLAQPALSPNQLRKGQNVSRGCNQTSTLYMLISMRRGSREGVPLCGTYTAVPPQQLWKVRLWHIQIARGQQRQLGVPWMVKMDRAFHHCAAAFAYCQWDLAAGCLPTFLLLLQCVPQRRSVCHNCCRTTHSECL